MAAFMAELRGHAIVDGEPVLTDGQNAFVQRLLDFYVERGLIVNDEAPPLRDCCANGAFCWRSGNPDDYSGGLSLPWIGPDYRPGGVVILGMNFNDAYGLAEAFAEALWELRALGDGHKRMTYDAPGYRGSDFAYRSTRSAGILIDVLHGSDVTEDEPPADEMVAVLKRLVRLQAVKCSPPTKPTGAPWPEMWERCPPMLLADEISLIRPGFIAAFGQPVRWALERIGAQIADEDSDLGVGTLAHSSGTAEVYCLHHPAAHAPHDWQASHASLAKHLRAR
jgi:hypothetical protein